MYTYSGISVTRKNKNAPTLLDIAIQTGRICRFGGATRRWWTVLHHQLAAGLFVQFHLKEDDPDFSEIQLAAYLHDAHEAITSDVPRDWKPTELSDWQEELDIRIYHSLQIPLPKKEIKLAVKAIDNALLVAEANQIAVPGVSNHPSIRELSKQLWPIIPVAAAAVYEICQRYKRPKSTSSYNMEAGDDAPAVQDYIKYVSHLIHKMDQKYENASTIKPRERHATTTK